MAAEAVAVAVGNGSTCSFGSLQFAVSIADHITFNCPNSTITWDNGAVITPNHFVSLDGAGQNVTLSGNNNRIFVVPAGGALNLNGLTLTNGFDSSGGGGGAIHNSGTLTITNSTISNSITTVSGSGGAIMTFATLTVSNSTFTGNSAGNAISGNSANNIIAGLGGADSLDGGAGVSNRTEQRDQVASHGDVGDACGRARTVDDGASGDEEVIHGGGS